MSEPTNAEMAEQEDMRLDAQIDEWYAQFLVPVNLPDASEPPEFGIYASDGFRLVTETEPVSLRIELERDAPPILVEVEECNP